MAFEVVRVRDSLCLEHFSTTALNQHHSPPTHQLSTLSASINKPANKVSSYERRSPRNTPYNALLSPLGDNTTRLPLPAPAPPGLHKSFGASYKSIASSPQALNELIIVSLKMCATSRSDHGNLAQTGGSGDHASG